jgi:dynein heavy chain
MLESVIAGESEPPRVEFASMVVILQERPDVDAAWSELASMKKADVMEVRAMKRPPRMVEHTFKALMLFLGMQGVPDSDPEETGGELWAAIKTQLLVSREHLLGMAEDLDLDECDASATLERIKPFLDDGDFHPDMVKRASIFGARVCAWIRASAGFLERRLGDER